MSGPQTVISQIEVQPSSPDATDFGQDVMDSIQALSRPVEMADLSPSKPEEPHNTEHSPSEVVEKDEGRMIGVEAIGSKPTKNEPQLVTSQSNSASPIDSAIGPATDKPTRIRSASGSGPQLIIILLLHSTQTRHPFIINEKYLKKRNISVAEDDPINMSVYTLKELIWRDWREEWEPRPASPTSIRLIHMGRMLDDKAYLKDSRFSCGETPHVVHMTMKPQEVIDDEDARIAKGGGRDRDGNERTAGCRCSVM